VVSTGSKFHFIPLSLEMEHEGILYKRLSEADFPALAILFRDGFHFNAGESYLRRKYDNAHIDLPVTAHIAFDGKKAVAFYGSVPMPVRMGEKRFRAVQICDFITLPDYRRKGIHARLADMTLEAARKGGADFAFAMHTEASLASSLRLGWKQFYALQVFSIPSGGIPWVAIGRRIPPLARQQEEKIRKHLLSLQIPRESYKNSFPVTSLHIDYSPAYMKFRTYTENYTLRIAGVPVWVKPDTRLRVGDINIPGNTELDPVVEELINLTRKFGLRELIFQTRPDTRLQEVLEGYSAPVPGFLFASTDFTGQAPVADLKLNYGDLDTF
jgi:GNAT superfamily N-acetyltransferase